MDGSYGSYGCLGCGWLPGRVSRPQSYGWFLWMVLMVPMLVWAADGCPVGVTDRRSVYVLDEEQLAPLRVH